MLPWSGTSRNGRGKDKGRIVRRMGIEASRSTHKIKNGTVLGEQVHTPLINWTIALSPVSTPQPGDTTILVASVGMTTLPDP